MKLGNTPESKRKYFQAYDKKRYAEFRKEIVKILGGKCAHCGSVKKLEIDHINPKSKKIEIGKRLRSWTLKLEKELAKCQLLCKPCHIAKTITDCGKNFAKGFHGTISSHRYCRCRECKDAYNVYLREYRRKRKLNR